MRWSKREARIFSCLADTLLAPRAPLPPVDDTDAVQAFGDWLARFPVAAQLGIRVLLLGLELGPRLRGRPWHALEPAQRLATVERIEASSGTGAALVAALRSATGAAYYGDRRVAQVVGYVAPEQR